jgi:nicotinamidase/pyrazinamidase
LEDEKMETLQKKEDKLYNKTFSNEVLFWNVDTQYDFMRRGGGLYVSNAESIEGNLERLTKHAYENNIRVINTADKHDKNTKEISSNPDYVDTFPAHCMQGTLGAEYIPATKPLNPYIIEWSDDSVDKEALISSRNIIIHKDALSTFTGNKHTGDIVDFLLPKSVMVYGVATNFCVDYAVRGLLDKGLAVYVVSDAIKEVPLHGEPDATISRWESIGVKMITTEEVIDKYVLLHR